MQRLGSCQPGKIRDFRPRSGILVVLVTCAMIPGVGVILPLLRPVGIYAFGNCIAVNAERLGGVGNALLVAREGLLDIELFKLGQGLIKHDVAIEHFFNHSF